MSNTYSENIPCHTITKLQIQFLSPIYKYIFIELMTIIVNELPKTISLIDNLLLQFRILKNIILLAITTKATTKNEIEFVSSSTSLPNIGTGLSKNEQKYPSL